MNLDIKLIRPIVIQLFLVPVLSQNALPNPLINKYKNLIVSSKKESKIKTPFETISIKNKAFISNKELEYKKLNVNNQIAQSKDQKIPRKYSNSIEWLPVLNEEKDNDDGNYFNYTYQESLRLLYNKELDFKLLNLGYSVPTAETLNEGDLRFEISQVSTFDSGPNVGTGNQNYLGKIDIGIRDNLMLSGFYTEADDPLQKTIKNKSIQPENLWSIFGANMRWRMINRNNYNFSMDFSLESWRVKSGGCSGFGCTNDTSNIFNSNIDAVDNTNLIGSISLPFTWNLSKPIKITATPRMVFLPEDQGNEHGKGKFYGNNIGLGIGVSYHPIKKLKLFSSAFIPFGSSTNSFDDNLNFNSTNIITTGITYTLDPRIALQGYITNSFGKTPSTSILTLPSDNQMLFGGKLIYTPTNLGEIPIDKTYFQQRRRFGGLSVTNGEIINFEEKRVKGSIDSDGTWWTKLDLGFSQLFSFDLATAKINRASKPKSEIAQTYLEPGAEIVRGGGTAIFFSQPRGDAITSGLRLSYGRSLGDQRPGYFFGELINTVEIYDNLSFNLNPKLSWSGTGSPSAIGTSIMWDIYPGITIIPEANFAISEAENNWTLAMRIYPGENNYLDFYTTNSLGFIDMGQTFSSKNQKFGVSLGTIF